MKRVLFIVLVFSILIALISCNRKKASKMASYDLSSMTWDAVVSQAQEEGSLTWFQWYLQPAFRKAVKSFEEKYDITVTITDGALVANTNKMLAEKDRETGEIDVISLGGDTLSTFDPTEYLYGPIMPILPDGTLLRTRIQGGDGQGYAVAFWGNQTGFAYDPDRIDERDLPQNFDGLGAWISANSKTFGFNIENGGSGPAFIQAVVKNINAGGVDFSSGESTAEKIEELSPAWDWLNSKEDDYIITASNADSLTRVSDGELIIVPAWEDHMAGLQKANEIDSRIQFYIPEFGMPGGGNVVGMPVNAPHKAAALLFISWLTSAETQSAFNRDFGSAPQHPDANADYALVPMSQRAFSTDAILKPFKDNVQNAFVDNVALD